MKDVSGDNEFIKLEKTVEDVLNQNNLQSVLYFSKIQKHWEIIVGKPLAAKTSPLQLFKKKLIVKVEDAAYSHHLKFFEQHILDLVASPEICGEGVVTKIAFKVGKSSQKLVPEQTDIPLKEPASHPLPIHPVANETSEFIEDQKLKASFSRLMSQCISKKNKSSK